MPYCIHCGVELNDRYDFCPLCQIKVEFPVKRKKRIPLYPSTIHKITIIQNPKSKKDWITIHFSGFICFMIILFTTGIDVFLNTTLTWSLFSSASTIYIYLQLILIINLKKNPFILYGNSNLLLGIFLFILDLLTPGDPWFAQYVLPCFISLQILSIILYIVFKNIKLEIYRTIITILTVNILLILINRIISNKITWAAITSSIAIPISIFLFYINYKIRNRENSHSTN